nr:MAG TPA: hypothetical protein [Caudoviricetes sp.]
MKLLDNGIFWQKNTLKKGKLVLLTILRIDMDYRKLVIQFLTRRNRLLNKTVSI